MNWRRSLEHLMSAGYGAIITTTLVRGEFHWTYTAAFIASSFFFARLDIRSDE